MSLLEIACAAEGSRYVAHSAAMLHSVLAQHREHEVRVHYMHGADVSARSQRRLAEMVERDGGAISFLRIADDELAGLPTRGFTRRATWYRILLPQLRANLDRILYLDADVLVLDSLLPLWESDLRGSYVGAVTNVFERHHAHRPAKLGLVDSNAYFNAGVLLMNLDQMRRDDCTRRLREYAVAHAPELLWRDQDALNVVLGGRRLALHPRWNCMNSILNFPWSSDVLGAEAVAEARRNPAIRHFEGPDSNKPWHYLCEREVRELYLEHRRRTPWPRAKPEGMTPLNILRRLWRRHVLSPLRRSGRCNRFG